MAEALDDPREFIEYRVREGFETAQKIVENACSWAWFKYKRDDLLPEVERLTAESLAAHQAEQATWKTPNDIRQTYATASIVANNRVVFNIKGNTYRLIVAINYEFGIVYIRFVGTHQDYDLVDAATV